MWTGTNNFCDMCLTFLPVAVKILAAKIAVRWKRRSSITFVLGRWITNYWAELLHEQHDTFLYLPLLNLSSKHSITASFCLHILGKMK